VSSTLLRLVLLTGCLALAACNSQPPATPTVPVDAEVVFWESIRDSKDPAEYRAYLDSYPQGRFASLARIRAATPAAEPTAKPAPVPAPQRKPATKPASTPQTSPPKEQQGVPSIVNDPAPPANWAKIGDVGGKTGPLLRSQIMDCWEPPPLPRGSGSFRAEIGIYFDPANGQVRGAAFLGGNRDMTDPLYARFVNTALAAPMVPACRALDLRQAGVDNGNTGLVLLFALDSPP